MVRVLSMPKYSVHVTDMRDGDIAVITEWTGTNEYVGIVVQRHGNDLITVGGGLYQRWTGVFTGHLNPGGQYMVEILPSGTTLEIQ